MKEAKLNEAQAAAAAHRKGPALVLAGPGSGKTTVITRRSLAVASELSRADRLLSVTFTRNAGAEMERRFCTAAGIPHDNIDEAKQRGQLPLFLTVHAFCNNVLSEYEMRSGALFERIEGERSPKRRIIADIYRRVNRHEADDTMITRIISYLGRSEDGGGQIRRYDDIARMYASYKREHKLIDFDDMICRCLDILKDDEAFATEISSRFDYIQVDEAQDLSRQQYDVIRIIGRNQNIFIVADDDQSIYGFRGADPTCIFDFVKSYDKCSRYELSRNYRSTSNIVDAASRLVSHNKVRFDKQLYSERERGKKVQVRRYTRGVDQCRHVCDIVSGGGAVLYRNSISALIIRLMLTYNGHSYSIRGGCERPRNITALNKLLKRIREEERAKRGLFVMTPRKTFERMLKEGFAEDIKTEYQIKREHARYVNAFLEFAALLTSLCLCYDDCVRILDTLESNDRYACSDESDNEQIVLSTVHSAKGLEFGRVCMIDLVEGEFPGRGSSSGALLEEERRLFYVGMTRAENILYLCVPLSRGGVIEEESRFVREIEK